MKRPTSPTLRLARGALRGHDVGEVGTGLALGVVIDQLVGDPRRGHPVALYGSAVSRVEKALYRDSTTAGALFAIVCVTGPVLLGRVLPKRAIALAAWVVLGGRSLASEGRAVRHLLDNGDLPGARRRLTHLAGRDPSELDAAGVSRAVVESLAENACDAVVAPLFWGAVAGVPGLLGYRAVNTLDAMVGHRTPRYRNFGRASARLDDLANLVPARLTVLLRRGVPRPASPR